MLRNFYSPRAKNLFDPPGQRTKLVVIQENTQDTFYRDGIRNWAWHCAFQWMIDTTLSRVDCYDIAFLEYAADFECYLLEMNALPSVIDIFGTPVDARSLFFGQATQILETYESVMRNWVKILFEVNKDNEPRSLGNVDSVHIKEHDNYLTVFVFVNFIHLLEHKQDSQHERNSTL